MKLSDAQYISALEKQVAKLEAENEELTAIIDRIPQTIYENICDELDVAHNTQEVE